MRVSSRRISSASDGRNRSLPFMATARWTTVTTAPLRLSRQAAIAHQSSDGLSDLPASLSGVLRDRARDQDLHRMYTMNLDARLPSRRMVKADFDLCLAPARCRCQGDPHRCAVPVLANHALTVPRPRDSTHAEAILRGLTRGGDDSDDAGVECVVGWQIPSSAGPEAISVPVVSKQRMPASCSRVVVK